LPSFPMQARNHATGQVSPTPDEYFHNNNSTSAVQLQISTIKSDPLMQYLRQKQAEVKGLFEVE
jgi:hypothetical protein